MLVFEQFKIKNNEKESKLKNAKKGGKFAQKYNNEVKVRRYHQIFPNVICCPIQHVGETYQNNQKCLRQREQNILFQEFSFQEQNHITLRGGGVANLMPIREDDRVQWFQKEAPQKAKKIFTISQSQIEKKTKKTLLIYINWFERQRLTFVVMASSSLQTEQFKKFEEDYFLMVESALSLLDASEILCLKLFQISNDYFEVILKGYQENKLTLRTTKGTLISKSIHKLQQKILNVNIVWKIDYEFQISQLRFQYNLYQAQIPETDLTKLKENLIRVLFNPGIEIANVIPVLFRVMQSFYFKLKIYLDTTYPTYIYFQKVMKEVIRISLDQNDINDALNQLFLSYQKNIKYSKDWKKHQCWINMITNLLIYDKEGGELQQNRTNQFNQFITELINRMRPSNDTFFQIEQAQVQNQNQAFQINQEIFQFQDIHYTQDIDLQFDHDQTSFSRFLLALQEKFTLQFAKLQLLLSSAQPEPEDRVDRINQIQNEQTLFQDRIIGYIRELEPFNPNANHNPNPDQANIPSPDYTQMSEYIQGYRTEFNTRRRFEFNQFAICYPLPLLDNLLSNILNFRILNQLISRINDIDDLEIQKYYLGLIKIQLALQIEKIEKIDAFLDDNYILLSDIYTNNIDYKLNKEIMKWNQTIDQFYREKSEKNYQRTITQLENIRQNLGNLQENEKVLEEQIKLIQLIQKIKAIVFKNQNNQNGLIANEIENLKIKPNLSLKILQTVSFVKIKNKLESQKNNLTQAQSICNTLSSEIEDQIQKTEEYNELSNRRTDQSNKRQDLELNENIQFLINQLRNQQLGYSITEIQNENLNINPNSNKRDGDNVYVIQNSDSDQESHKVLNLLFVLSDKLLINSVHQQDEKNEDEDDKQTYKIRSCYINRLRQIIELSSSGEDERLKSFCLTAILQIWVTENNDQVKKVLNSNKIQKTFKKFSRIYRDQINNKIQNTFQDILNKIQNIKEQLKTDQKNSNLLQKLSKYEEEFNQYCENVETLEEKIEVQIHYLKELKEQQREIKKDLEEINKMMLLIKGEDYQQLLDQRKKNVFQQQKDREFLNYIHVNLQCKSQDKQIDLMDAIKQFINEETANDVLLIKGDAGSGKSRLGVQIEVMLWENHKKESDWTPILVSLQHLQNPETQLFSETLKSEFYSFVNSIQISQFRQNIKQGKRKLVLILDDYDKIDFKGNENLYDSNHLNYLLNQQKDNLKLIILTRIENVNKNIYTEWFRGSKDIHEIQIMDLQDEQFGSYVKQYSINLIQKKLYSQFCQKMQDEFDSELSKISFTNFWNFIKEEINSYQSQAANIANHSEIEELKDQKIPVANHSNENRSDYVSIKQGYDNAFVKFIMEKIFVASNQYLYTLEEGNISFSEEEFTEISTEKQILNQIDALNIKQSLKTPLNLESTFQILFKLKLKNLDDSSFQEQFIAYYVLLKSKKRNNFSYHEQDQDLEQEVRQILPKIKTRCDKQPQNIYKSLQDLPDISIVNDRDIILRAIMKKEITPYEFQRSYIEFYYESLYKKQKIYRLMIFDSFFKSVLHFSIQLAVEMTKRNLTKINYLTIGIKNSQSLFQEKEPWLNQIIEQGEQFIKFILIQSEGNFAFYKSQQEFFVSMYILQTIDGLNQKIEQNKEQLRKTYYNEEAFNLSSKSFEKSIFLIQGEMKRRLYFNKTLIELVKLSAEDKGFTPSASNSLYLLSVNKCYLGNQQFQNIKIQNTNLFPLNFERANLENTIFTNVKLDSCNFVKANLERIKWERIEFTDLYQIYEFENGIIDVDFTLSINSLSFMVKTKDQKMLLRKINDSKKSKKSIQKFENKFTNENSIINYYESSPFKSVSFSDKKLVVGNQHQVMEEKIENIIFLQGAKCLVCIMKNSIKIFQFDKKSFEEKNTIARDKTTFQKSKIFFFDSDKMICCDYQEEGKQGILIWDRKENKLQKDLKINFQQFIVIKNTLVFLQEKLLSIMQLTQPNQFHEIKLKHYCKNMISGQKQEQLYLQYKWRIEKINITDRVQKTIVESNISKIVSSTVSTNEQYLAYLDETMMIYIYDNEEPTLLWVFAGYILDSQFHHLKFSPNNEYLAYFTEGSKIIQQWEICLEKQINSDYQRGVQRLIVFSFDSSKIAITYQNNSIGIWDKDGQQIQELNKNQDIIILMTFSLDGLVLASGSQNQEIKCWDVFLGYSFFQINLQDPVFLIQFQTFEEIRCIQNDQTILLINIYTEKNEPVSVPGCWCEVFRAKNMILSSQDSSYALLLSDKIIYFRGTKESVSGVYDEIIYISNQHFLYRRENKYFHMNQNGQREDYSFAEISTDGNYLIRVDQGNVYFGDKSFSYGYQDRRIKKIQVPDKINPENIVFAIFYETNNINQQKSIELISSSGRTYHDEVDKIFFYDEHSYVLIITTSRIYKIRPQDSEYNKIVDKDIEQLESYGQRIGTPIFNFNEGKFIQFFVKGNEILKVSLNIQVNEWYFQQWQKLDQISLKCKSIQSPDQKMIAVVSERIINIFMTDNNEKIQLIGHCQKIKQIRFSFDNQLLASFDKQIIFLWDIKSGNIIGYFTDFYPKKIKFIKDREILLLQNENNFLPWYYKQRKIGNLRYNVIDDKFKKILEQHYNQQRQILNIILSTEYEGKQFIALQVEYNNSDNFQQKIEIWDAKGKGKKNIITEEVESCVACMAFDQKSQYFAYSCLNKSIKLLHLEKNKLESVKFKQLEFVRFIFKLTFSSISKYLLIETLEEIFVYDIQKSASLYPFSLMEKSLIQISPDGELLADIKYDKCAVLIWHFASQGTVIKDESHKFRINQILFSPDSLILMTQSVDQIVKLWNIQKDEKKFNNYKTIDYTFTCFQTIAHNYFTEISSKDFEKQNRYKIQNAENQTENSQQKSKSDLSISDSFILKFCRDDLEKTKNYDFSEIYDKENIEVLQFNDQKIQKVFEDLLNLNLNSEQPINKYFQQPYDTSDIICFPFEKYRTIFMILLEKKKKQIIFFVDGAEGDETFFQKFKNYYNIKEYKELFIKVSFGITIKKAEFRNFLILYIRYFEENTSKQYNILGETKKKAKRVYYYTKMLKQNQQKAKNHYQIFVQNYKDRIIVEKAEIDDIKAVIFFLSQYVNKKLEFLLQKKIDQQFIILSVQKPCQVYYIELRIFQENFYQQIFLLSKEQKQKEQGVTLQLQCNNKLMMDELQMSAAVWYQLVMMYQYSSKQAFKIMNFSKIPYAKIYEESEN